MALTPTVQVSQADTMAVTTATTQGVRVPQGDVVVVYNFPSDGVEGSQADVSYVTAGIASDMNVSQADVIAILGGRVSDPKIRAWTFTLDGHDFYVLRLGNDQTLVFDRLAEQWYVWGSSETELWRAFTGQNWEGGQEFLSKIYGSNIIVGDDGNGALYFLDPNKLYDDDALEGEDVLRTFLRRVTGQMPTRSIDHVDDFGVQLIGSIGKATEAALTAVTLSTSDDQGETYDDQGTITVDNSDFDARVEWRSLGSYNAPGRLYRVEDVGALQRIDYLETLGDEDDDG